MSMLIIVRGLPASGKSSEAIDWVSTDPRNRARVNRDLMRLMLHDGYCGSETERLVTALQLDLIADLLMRGKDVVCDDTNLPEKTVKNLLMVAYVQGADWEIWDKTNISPESCVLLNDSKHRHETNAHVPEQVIWDMYEKYIKGNEYPLPVPEV